MAANILNSPRVVQMSMFVVRAAVRLIGMLPTNKALADKLAELGRKVGSHDGHIRSLFEAVRQLAATSQTRPRRIGFLAQEPKEVGKGRRK